MAAFYEQTPRPFPQKEQHGPETISQEIKSLLGPKLFRDISPILQRLDANPDLTLSQKRIFFQLLIWEADPTLKGKIAIELEIEGETIESNLNILGNNEDLEDFYKKLLREEQPIEPHPETDEKDVGLEELPKEPLNIFVEKPPQQETTIDRLRHIPPGKMSPREMARELNITPSTARSYRSTLIKAGKIDRTVPTNRPDPKTIQLRNLAAQILKTEAEKGIKITNKAIAERTSAELQREITVPMVRVAIFDARALEHLPERRPRRVKKTWSTSKEAGQDTMNQLKILLNKHRNAHPTDSIDIKQVASELSINPSYARRLYNKLAKTEEVPPSKTKPKPPITSEQLTELKEKLVTFVNKWKIENSDKVLSWYLIAKNLGRSIGYVKKLYKQVFGKRPELNTQ